MRALSLASVVALSITLTGLFAPRALAQCDCDHTLGLEVTEASGADLGVMPGDRVCVTAGERPFLRLREFTGTAAAPITVLNCGGLVTIRNTDRAYALVIEGASEHVRVTGTGDDTLTYGFRVSAPDLEPYPGIGLWILGRATDIEADHMEVFETGFAGVMAKTDPACEDRPFWDGFVQRNTHLHHLWVHDTGGEGFYIGSTQAMGYNRMCDGAMVNIPHHDLEGVDVHDVLIEDTGWDGIQIGFATDCAFHDSVIRRVGLEGVEFQMQGLQLGTSVCEVRRNDLRDGPAMGIIVLDVGTTTIADNVIANFMGDGIYANTRDASPGTWNFVHNTIAFSTGAAIRGFSDSDGMAVNNLLIGNGSDVTLGAAIESADNVSAPDVATAGVVSRDDLHLTDASSARGAGRDLTAMGYALDLDLRARAMPPSVGAYEHVADVPDVGPIDAATSRPDVGTTPRDASSAGSDAGPPTSNGGCGCRASRPRAEAVPFLFGLLALVAIRRRYARGTVTRS